MGLKHGGWSLGMAFSIGNGKDIFVDPGYESDLSRITDIYVPRHCT